jgi:type IV secretion system protein VirB10
MRLSRKVLIGLAALAAVTIFSALAWALHQTQGKPTGGELYNTENKSTAEGLSALPRDYTSIPANIPVLGPPLPGDLGRPIRNAQLAVSAPGELGIDAEQQRLVQEGEAARTSRLFATTNARERPNTPTMSPASMSTDQSAAAQVGRGEGPPLDPDSILNMQDRKLSFLTAPVDRRTISRDRLANPASQYIVQAGAVIPAALITGIRSDLPG